MGRLDRICTTGFSKLSERQVFIWDSSDVAKGPVKQLTVDVSSGTLMPFWSDNDVLVRPFLAAGLACLLMSWRGAQFLAGKGDGNVRYYEFEADDLCVSRSFACKRLLIPARRSHYLYAQQTDGHGRNKTDEPSERTGLSTRRTNRNGACAGSLDGRSTRATARSDGRSR